MTKVLVNTFRKGKIEICEDENSKLNFLTGKVIFDKCPVCGENSEQDLLYSSPSASGLEYACGHVAHFKKGKDPVYE